MSLLTKNEKEYIKIILKENKIENLKNIKYIQKLKSINDSTYNHVIYNIIIVFKDYQELAFKTTFYLKFNKMEDGKEYSLKELGL